jgi:hypothetical protein
VVAAKAISHLLYFEANAARNADAAQQQSLDAVKGSQNVRSGLLGLRQHEDRAGAAGVRLIGTGRPVGLARRSRIDHPAAPDHWRMPALNRLIYRR